MFASELTGTRISNTMPTCEDRQSDVLRMGSASEPISLVESPSKYEALAVQYSGEASNLVFVYCGQDAWMGCR
jgi:hypothetical protein